MSRAKINACPDPETWPKWFHQYDKPYCAALAPIFDMINHQNGVTGFSWTHEDGVLFYSEEKIKTGDELFHSYLDGTAITLLSMYGFIDKEIISQMQFTIPEIRLGKFYQICYLSKREGKQFSNKYEFLITVSKSS